MTADNTTDPMTRSRKAAAASFASILVVTLLITPGTTGIDGALWTTDGTLNPSWEYGENADGVTVWATGIDNPANRRECSYIQSPPLPGSLFIADGLFPRLEIRHSHEMLRLGGSAYDAGIVKISMDRGATWSLAPMTDYDSIGVAHGSPGGMTHANHCRLSIDPDADMSERGWYTGTSESRTSLGILGPILPTDQIVVRLIYWGGKSDYDPAVPMDGWEIESVRLGIVDLDLIPPLPTLPDVPPLP